MRWDLRAMIGGAVLVAALASPAFADDLEGAYVGAGVGLGRVEFRTRVGGASGTFDETHFAYHLSFGIHPTGTPLALQLEYLDLGEPKVPSSATPILYGTVSQRGGGLFLLYYLPTPVVQAYVKAGGSRITTHAGVVQYCASPATSPGGSCPLSSSNPTNNSFAYGAGLQWTLGRWAVRGEYERFNAGGGHPSLLTVGVDWMFL